MLTFLKSHFSVWEFLLHASLRFQLENTFSFVFIYTLLIFQNNLVPAVFENRRDGTGRWIIIISSFDQCIYDTLLHFYATWYYRKKDLLKIFYNFHWCNVVRDYEIACWKSSYDWFTQMPWGRRGYFRIKASYVVVVAQKCQGRWKIKAIQILRSIFPPYYPLCNPGG